MMRTEIYLSELYEALIGNMLLYCNVPQDEAQKPTSKDAKEGKPASPDKPKRASTGGEAPGSAPAGAAPAEETPKMDTDGDGAEAPAKASDGDAAAGAPAEPAAAAAAKPEAGQAGADAPAAAAEAEAMDTDAGGEADGEAAAAAAAAGGKGEMSEEDKVAASVPQPPLPVEPCLMLVGRTVNVLHGGAAVQVSGAAAWPAGGKRACKRAGLEGATHHPSCIIHHASSITHQVQEERSDTHRRCSPASMPSATFGAPG